MQQHDEHWTQTATGLLVPKPPILLGKWPVQAPQLAIEEDPEQDWEGYWTAQGQPWRREAEIDVRRQVRRNYCQG
jgi:hypothetical protein